MKQKQVNDLLNLFSHLHTEQSLSFCSTVPASLPWAVQFHTVGMPGKNTSVYSKHSFVHSNGDRKKTVNKYDRQMYV